MSATLLYCPECEADGKRRYLVAAGAEFCCPDCKSRFSAETLRLLLEAERQTLLADADWIRDTLLPMVAA